MASIRLEDLSSHTSCENAHFSSGDDIQLTSYCSQECADADWPNHKAQCLHSRALFDEARVIRRLFYIVYDMDLDCAIDEGFPISTKVSHDTKTLQRRMYAAVNASGATKLWYLQSELLYISHFHHAHNTLRTVKRTKLSFPIRRMRLVEVWMVDRKGVLDLGTMQ